jgi:hypothetical protein
MAGNADDHSAPTRTIDDLFRLLIVRDFPLARARMEIMEQLQRNHLKIDVHIRGGVRKILPQRPATEQELQGGRPIGAAKGAVLEMFHVYETSPPEGITERVHYQDWGRLLNLLISDDERLIVELEPAFEYPESAYSFTIANWSSVAELWPTTPIAPQKAATPAPAPEDQKPKDWFADAKKRFPSRPKQGVSSYAKELEAEMKKELGARAWSWETIRKRLYDK